MKDDAKPAVSDTVRAVVRKIPFRKCRYYPAPQLLGCYYESYWEGVYVAPDGSRKLFIADTLRDARAKARIYIANMCIRRLDFANTGMTLPSMVGHSQSDLL